jgi:hypothetical protein
MGGVYIPGSPGITVKPTDRESGPGAGAGAVGNRAIFLGSGSGLNSTPSDIVLIGNNVGGTTAYTDAGMQGTTVIGSGAVPNGGDCTTDIGTGTSGAVTSVGWQNAKAMVGGARVSGLIMIGANILPNMPMDAGGGNWSRNVFIGNNIAQNNTSGAGFASSDNVFVGYQVGQLSSAGNCQYLENTLIGSRVCNNIAAATNLSGNTVIGARCAQSLGSNGNTIIGDQTANSLTNGGSNIVIGSSANLTGAAANTTIIGNNIVIGASSKSVYVGNGTGVTPTFTGSRNVMLGYNFGSGATVGQNDIFLVETNDVTQFTMFYGRFDTGNLAIGKLASGNRDLDTIAATNAVKLTNGTRGAGNPVGGGFFYVSAGLLRWVDTNGVDTQLSVSATGQLASNAIVAYTNNSAAAAGTLTNAPVAGNPTKWIPINDNGTIRNIPAW